jgi:hypothetical protein
MSIKLGLSRFVRAALTGVALMSVSLEAQAADAARPDFSGVYLMRRNAETPRFGPYKLTPKGQAGYDRNRKAVAEGDSSIDVSLDCLPTGVPRLLFGPLPISILQTPKLVGWIGETDPVPRLIYLDRPHRADYWPTFNGDSVGHWEGDTLVVDTVKLTTQTFLDMPGLPHSDKLTVNERLHLIEGGKALQNDVTITDPETFTEPYKITYVYDRRDDLQPVETVCENSRDKP